MGLIVFALSSCSGCCLSSSAVDFSSAVRERKREKSHFYRSKSHNAEYLAAWRTICLPQNHRPSYPSVLQAVVRQPAKAVRVVQHSLRAQEEPPSSRQTKRGIDLTRKRELQERKTRCAVA